MPRVHDRVQLVLAAAGIAAIFFASFLNFAPNRLARSAAHGLLEAPSLQKWAVIGALAALFSLSLMKQQRTRSAVACIAAGVLSWGILAAAGSLAFTLTAAGPPAARASPGAAFWTLGAVAVFAIASAMQTAHLGLLARSVIGLFFCAAAVIMAAAGSFDQLSLVREFANISGVFLKELLRHVSLVGAAALLALLISVPLTLVVLRRQTLANAVLASLAILQTVPSIALFGVLIAPLSRLGEHFPFFPRIGISGTGAAPAIIALILYSLLPLVRSFHAGLSGVAPDVKEAAAALGFNRRQILLKIEVPLALPALLSGLRVATVQAIGLATVAALIGAGGLGTFIFQGIGQYALDLVLLGAFPVILLALIANFAFELLLRLAPEFA